MNTKLAKLNASQEADEALERVLARVNDEFTGGRVTKTQLASWILIHFEKSQLEKLIPKIQDAHFDEVSYLKSVVASLKHSKADGDPSPSLESMLSRLRPKLKSRRNVTSKESKPIGSSGNQTNQD